jgi:hypothetical protein
MECVCEVGLPDVRRQARTASRELRLKIRVLAVCKTLGSVLLLRFAIYIHPKTTPSRHSRSSVLEGPDKMTISLISMLNALGTGGVP